MGSAAQLLVESVGQALKHVSDDIQLHAPFDSALVTGPLLESADVRDRILQSRKLCVGNVPNHRKVPMPLARWMFLNQDNVFAQGIGETDLHSQ